MDIKARHLTHGSAYRSQFRYHERFGYWYRPNLRLRIPGSERDGTASYTFVTNSAGARTRREPASRDDGRSRVLFIGCSMTAGDSVGNRHRFTDLLEQELGWIACHNYALSGSGNDQQHLVHERFAPIVDPDVLVLSPATACADRNLVGHKVTYDPLTDSLVRRPKPYFVLEDGTLALRNVPVPRRNPEPQPAEDGGGRGSPSDGRSWRERVARALGALASALRAKTTLQHPAYAIPGHPAHELTRRILVATLRASRARRKILMPVPTHVAALDPAAGQYQAFFGAVAEEGGAEHLEPIDRYATFSRSKRRLLYFSHDGHLTEYGHEQIARLLADRLGRSRP